MDIDFEVNWALIIQTLIATVLPLIVGLVTTRVTRGIVKALLLAGLSIISSGLTQLLAAITAEETFDLGTWLVAAVGTFAVAVATHYGLWKPTGTTEKVQAVGAKRALTEPPSADSG
jgi:hypothetical protein